MAKENGQIIVDYGVIRQIAQEVSISPVTIGKVLKGIKLTSDENYNHIRDIAVTKYNGFYRPA